MAADFVAGYVSGAIGIVVGNPLDLIKVRLQAQASATGHGPLKATTAFSAGTAAPILGYGALNAVLFVSYKRSEAVLNELFATKDSLITTWLAGACGGLATWVISAPTELIKCRAQTSTSSLSSVVIAHHLVRERGVLGLYHGGVVTALRDGIGYGFYFWSYELSTGLWQVAEPNKTASIWSDGPRVLLCGGFAGIATWASVFPLDVIKTRVQTQAIGLKRCGAFDTTCEMLRLNGPSIFFRGFAVCCIRAFFVNAIQWAVYEGIMGKLKAKS